MNLYEKLTENFHRWEQRGRGALLHPSPVQLEPPFVPFPGHRVKFEGPVDDGSRPTFLSRFGEKVAQAFQLRNTPSPPRIEETCEPEPDWFGEEATMPIEFKIRLSPDDNTPRESFAHFLTSLSLIDHPLALEIVASQTEIILQLACQEEDADSVLDQIESQFPNIEVEWSSSTLVEAWVTEDGSERVVVDFGLEREFMMPLETNSKLDPFVSLMGALENLAPDEAAIFQVIFTPLTSPWASEVMQSVTKGDGKPFFDDGADLVKQASSKVARPLYGVALRLAAKSEDLTSAWNLIRAMAASLRFFSRVEGQALTPLVNDDYDHEAHCADVLWRRSRRSGMILNLDELAGLAHWPSSGVKSAKLARIVEDSSRAAPETGSSEAEMGTVSLGVNEHSRTERIVSLTALQRLQHMHIIGGSGTGKSTLLFSMMQQDLESGQGFALLDPHGDLIDRVLANVPAYRMGDVVLLDPSDENFVTPFNVLSAHSDHEKTLLASDLVSVFRRLSTSWGDRMGIIFQNLTLAFLEHRDGGTLADMRRFLIDANWRKEFLRGVDDPDIIFYWEQTFPKLDGPKSVGPILTRLETLLTPKIIRYMVSQKENRIDFGEIMDRGRILLVKLPQGQIGTENAFMLGSLVMVKLQQMAMGRARMAAKDRTPFFCYVDECQHFVTPSMAAILSGARKYGLGLILAHQDLHQLAANGDVAAAVMTNAYTRVVFRVSESDGRALKGEFAHYETKDFASLARGHAICRIERADQDFNLRVVPPDDPDEAEAEARRDEAIESSRQRYTIPRHEVESEIRRRALGSANASPDEPTPRKETPKQELRTPEVSSRKIEPNIQPPKDTAKSIEPPPSNPAPEIKQHGKGGQEHREKQSLLKEAAEVLGFRAEKEVRVGEGLESVDVVLTRGDLRIACEISVTTTVEHELANARKCLQEPFNLVALICDDAGSRAKMQIGMATGFSEEERGRLRSDSLDAFLDFLKALPAPKPAAAERIVRGFKVKRKFVSLTPQERKAKTEEAFRLLCAEMRQPPPKT